MRHIPLIRRSLWLRLLRSAPAVGLKKEKDTCHKLTELASCRLSFQSPRHTLSENLVFVGKVAPLERFELPPFWFVANG
jgi:hypothetical protein